MRILVLDDDKIRHRTFQRNLIGHERVLHVYTVEAAREALEAEVFDVVFFDHDLNDYESKSLDYSQSNYGGPREMTGVDVAMFISRLPPEKHPKLAVIHSFNPGGAMNIAAVMRTTRAQVVTQPFHSNIGSDLRG